jgi:putative Mg2+ transporter-C (MgtC) family protein
MVLISKLEAWLPSRQAVAITLKFRAGFNPDEEVLRKMATSRGFEIAGGTISIALKEGCPEWQFVAVARSRQNMLPISELAREMTRFDGVTGFNLAYARN